MSQLEAIAEAVRQQTATAQAARQAWAISDQNTSDLFEVWQAEEKLLMQAQERLLDVASREPQLAQTA
jgi:hypothetical protein